MIAQPRTPSASGHLMITIALVIVGESMPTEGAAKCFGLVTSYDTKPRRRLFETLKGQGLQNW